MQIQTFLQLEYVCSAVLGLNLYVQTFSSIRPVLVLR